MQILYSILLAAAISLLLFIVNFVIWKIASKKEPQTRMIFMVAIAAFEMVFIMLSFIILKMFEFYDRNAFVIALCAGFILLSAAKVLLLRRQNR